MAPVPNINEAARAVSGKHAFVPRFASSGIGGKNSGNNGWGSSVFAPRSEGAKVAPREAGGKTSSAVNSVRKSLTGGKLTDFLRSLRAQGFYFRIHRFRSNGRQYIYLKARKRVNGRVKELTITSIREEQLGEIRNLIRRVMNSSNGKSSKHRKARKTAGKAHSSSTTINSSSKPCSQVPNQPHGTNGDRGGVGGSARASAGVSVASGFVLPRFVHRVVLRFVRPWVSPLYLSVFGGVRFVERSKQYILKMEVGDRRWVTVQVNRDGTAQVFLEASNNPLGLEEFIGFCRFYLLWLFRKITGRSVGLEDFIVLAAPEFNLDLDGVNLLEGLGARSLTLKKFLSDIVRIYYTDPGVKTSMPNGGTRVEARPSSYKGMNLKELVDGIVASAELPRFLSSLKKEVEEVKELVKGGVSLRSLEKQGFANLVATKLANYLELLWRRIEERLKQWIRELTGRIADALQSYINELLQRIRALEEENKRLRNRVRELEDKLKIMNRVEEYRRHPGWEKLLELATPGPGHPALVSIDLEKGMVYFSPELWRYIRSRTRNGALRGLDKQLLDKVRDYHGEHAVELLLEMQRYGGRISVDEALKIMHT